MRPRQLSRYHAIAPVRQCASAILMLMVWPTCQYRSISVVLTACTARTRAATIIWVISAKISKLQDSAVDVEIEHNAWAHLIAFNHSTCNQAAVYGIGFRVLFNFYGSDRFASC